MRNLLLLILFTLFFVIDVTIDFQHGVALPDILHELVFLLVGLAAIGYQIAELSRKNREISQLSQELLNTKKEYRDWKRRAESKSRELGDLIDEQFGLWHLSDSEREVALLLIKGLAMKEIAHLRQTHEKTVRQQATTIYRKAGLAGRQELAAFFLEDVLASPLLGQHPASVG